jgi:nucleotide-binding universal stress UspA family protein
MFGMKRILVPVDFSPESALALEWGVKLAGATEGATIYLLHIDGEPIPVDSPELRDQVVAFDRAEARRQLEAWQTRVPPSLAAVVLSRIGEIAEQIHRVCDEHAIELVVLTTHGREGLSRIFHPNAAEKIVRTAPCPVLVLHMNPQTQAMTARIG